MQITGTPLCFWLFKSPINVNHTSSKKNKVPDEKSPLPIAS
jgi:hypothetical protein